MGVTTSCLKASASSPSLSPMEESMLNRSSGVLEMGVPVKANLRSAFKTLMFPTTAPLRDRRIWASSRTMGCQLVTGSRCFVLRDLGRFLVGATPRRLYPFLGTTGGRASFNSIKSDFVTSDLRSQRLWRRQNNVVFSQVFKRMLEWFFTLLRRDDAHGH